MPSKKVDVGGGKVNPKMLSITRNIRSAGFEEKPDFKELLESVRARMNEGLQPILEPVSWYYKGGKAFALLGHRRVRVGQILGINIPGIKVDPPVSESQRIIDQLTENEFRADIDPISKAQGYKTILEENPDKNQQWLAGLFHKSTSYVSQHLALLTLEQEIQDAIAEGTITVAVGYQMTTKLTDEQRKANMDTVMVAAQHGTNKAAKAAISTLGQLYKETENMFEEFPEPVSSDPPQDIPKTEPPDESVLRITATFNMIEGLIRKVKGEAHKASLDIGHLLQKLIVVINEEVAHD